MKKSFQILFLIVTLTTPLFLATTGMRIALTPLFINIEYNLPNFPNDDFGLTTEDRLFWADFAIEFIAGNITEDEFSKATFPDGSLLFNEREIAHMIDVRNLTVIMLTIWRILVLFNIVVMMIGLRDKKWLRALFQSYRNGAKITLVLIMGILAFVWINFNKLFTLFHQLFFEGDSWLFYLSDTLIRLFPIKFWQDLFIFIGSFGIISSLLIIILSKYQGEKIKARV